MGNLATEHLEPRLALAITLPIQDLTGVASAGYDVWVSGHGIPGWQAPHAPPLLMSLTSDGSFAQTATAIASASHSLSTAKITTQAPHGLHTNDTVFIAGTSQPDQPSYDGSYVITVTGDSSFTFTTTATGLGPITNKGTVYTSTLVKSQPFTSVTTVSVNPSPSSGPPFGLAEVTTSAAHGLSPGQTIEISGVTGPAGTYAGVYNGVYTVGQVPTPNTFEYQFYFGSMPVPQHASDVGPGGSGTVKSVAIEPVKVSSLPSRSISLDESMTNISARLYFFVAEETSGPSPISLNGISPSDPKPPPFNPSQTLPTSIFDIVEFAYLPTGVTSTATVATYTMTGPHGLNTGDLVAISGVVDASGHPITGYNGNFHVASVPTPMTFTVNGSFGLPQGGSGSVSGTPSGIQISPSFSTFDVSAVDGLAIPMTLTASQVKTGSVSSVGINTEAAFTRESIGQAFGLFMAGDPLGHTLNNPNQAARDFSKLLYETGVSLPSITGVTASWSNNVATFTLPATATILPGEMVVISGFTGAAAGYNGPFQVLHTPAPTATTFAVSNATLTQNEAGTGGTVTPQVFQTPALPAGQFNAIAAPKDWLANQQPPSLASQDALATFWDQTIENFFHAGNSLSIYLGKEPTGPIYSGSSDGTKFTLTNRINTFDFPKPAPGLASALYVWSQPDPGTDDKGLLQDQIWQALCRGVAFDGLNPVVIHVAAATSTSFVKPENSNPLGIATITTQTPHGLQDKSSAIIAGVSVASYDGTHLVTRVDDHTFTYTYAATNQAVIDSAVVGTYDSVTNTTPVTVTLHSGTTPQHGQVVYLDTISIAAYNGQHTVTGASGNTFTYSLPGDQSGHAQGNGGNVWGGLYAAGTGGTVDAGGSSTAWNDHTKWYTQRPTSFSGFESVYCPYSKFLHYSTLQGTVDTTGTTSIFLGNAAYGFGEDENPIGNPYTGPLVPSKLDGTVYDDSTVTIRLSPWTDFGTYLSGDFNADGLTDIATRLVDGNWQVALTQAAGDATLVSLSASNYWTTNVTWVDWSVLRSGDRDVIVARAELPGEAGSWWKLSYDGPVGGTNAADFSTNFVGSWSFSGGVQWIDVVSGDFDGSGTQDIVGRDSANNQWWMLADATQNSTSGSFGTKNIYLGSWSSEVQWDQTLAGNFMAHPNGKAQVAGLTGGMWWLSEYEGTPGQMTHTLMTTQWARHQHYTDYVVGNFDGNANGAVLIAAKTENNAWYSIGYDSSVTPQNNLPTLMGTWPDHTSTYSNVLVGDFFGSGAGTVGIAGLQRSGSNLMWQVLERGTGGGSYSVKNFGPWPQSTLAQAFAGLFSSSDISSGKTGVLGRRQSGGVHAWERGVSNGDDFTVSPVTGYPA